VIVLLGSGISINATAGGNHQCQWDRKQSRLSSAHGRHRRLGIIQRHRRGASVNVRHTETAAGSITFNAQANGLIEDCYLHDRPSIITGNSAGFITVRRTHVKKL